MQNTIEAVEALLQKLQSADNRGKGHTQSAFNHATAIKAVFIAHSVSSSKALKLNHIDWKSPRQIHPLNGPIVLDHFTWESMARDLLDIINDLRMKEAKLKDKMENIRRISSDI